MITNENENLVSRYDDPELSAAERRELIELLETDDEARDLEAQYRRLDAELETLPDGLDGVDFTGFRRRIRESIETAPVIRRPYRQLWTRWAPIAAAASMAIAFVSIWHSLSPEAKKQIDIHRGNTGIVEKVKPAPVNRVLLVSAPAPSGARVNRIQLGASASAAVEPSFAMDMENESVYDDGGVICFVGGENDEQETTVPSPTGFFGTLLKGST